MLRFRGMNTGYDHLHWREQESKLVKRCSIFDLYESQRQSANGQQGTFHLLESRDWVNVVAPIEDGEGRSFFLMVRQFRHGIERITVEFPAGLIEPGEQPEEAARRELAEETGFQAGKLKLIGRVAPNPAFMNNYCHTFCASGLRSAAEQTSTGGQKLDELELLDVLRVPVEELQEHIGENPYWNAMTALALYWYQRSGVASA